MHAAVPYTGPSYKPNENPNADLVAKLNQTNDFVINEDLSAVHAIFTTEIAELRGRIQGHTISHLSRTTRLHELDTPSACRDATTAIAVLQHLISLNDAALRAATTKPENEMLRAIPAALQTPVVKAFTIISSDPHSQIARTNRHLADLATSVEKVDRHRLAINSMRRLSGELNLLRAQHTNDVRQFRNVLKMFTTPYESDHLDQSPFTNAAAMNHASVMAVLHRQFIQAVMDPWARVAYHNARDIELTKSMRRRSNMPLPWVLALQNNTWRMLPNLKGLNDSQIHERALLRAFPHTGQPAPTSIDLATGKWIPTVQPLDAVIDIELYSSPIPTLADFIQSSASSSKRSRP